MKVEVEIPNGNYCTGCPLSIYVFTPWSRRTVFGCNYLNKECKPYGEYDRAKKHPDCPSLKHRTRTIKSPHKAGTVPLRDIRKAIREARGDKSNG